MHGLDLAILDDKGVALGARVTEDGHKVKAEIQGLGEGACGISQEPDLNHCEHGPPIQQLSRSELTPDSFLGSSVAPQAFILFDRLVSLSLSVHSMSKLGSSRSRGCYLYSRTTWGQLDSHECIIDAHDEDFTGLACFAAVNVARDVFLRAAGGEGGGDAYDEAVGNAAVVLGQVHLVGGRVLVQVDVGNGIADLDEGARRAVELARGQRARHGRGHSAKSAERHCCGIDGL